MTPLRTWCLLVGLLGISATAVLLVHPSAGRALPFDDVGLDYLVVGALGLVTVVSAIALLGVRSFAGVREVRPPAVETPAREPPRDIVAETLADLPPVRVTETHRRLHEQLRELTISAVVQRQHCSRAEAEHRLQAGTWTTDPLAIEFLRSCELDPPSLPARLLNLLRGRRWYRDRVVATVRALEQLEGMGE